MGAVVPDRLMVDLGRDGQAAVVTWPDRGLPEEVARVPLAWPLDDGTLEDLRWYLEDYLSAPYGVWEERGPVVRGKLAGWGDQVFGSVFGAGPARAAYQRARDRELEVVFRSADPGLLGMPWELMRDSGAPVALGTGGISRSLLVEDGAEPLEVPGGRLRVLMVISRPRGTSDVGYQIVARPLLERLEAVRGEIELTVLRPPAFDALAEMVRRAAEAGEPFHVVHFDGHGVMPGRAIGGRPDGRSAGLTGPGDGMLAFELPGWDGHPHYIEASRVAAALVGGRVPVVVLNACQSGAMGKKLEASVATALVKAGCAAVVAMAYSVYAVAAAEFMTAFYESLFAGDSVGQAVTAGRRRLFRRNGRPSPKGDMPLEDWLVPVHYMRREVRFPDARTRRPAAVAPLDEALDEIRAGTPEATADPDPLAAAGAFVGRDDLFYQLETAARQQRVVILTGPGGTGKTELAKGFARWWRGTGGVDDPRLVLWHSFVPGVASFGLDGVIASIGLALSGTDFPRLEPLQRLEAVKQVLARHRALLVWDNFESVAEMPDPARVTPPLDEAGRAQLREFLDWARYQSRSTVIITSRAQEGWLGEVRRIAVGGLNQAEAAQYAGHLLAPFPAAQRRRQDRAFGELLEWLDGHPLAMRLTLPRLEVADPDRLLAGLRGTTPLHGGDDAGQRRLSSLGACITYSFTHLSEQARRLLPALSLLHGTADPNILVALSATGNVPARFAGVSRQEWMAVLQDAARVGLLTAQCRIHPALPGYLTARWRAEDPGRFDQERGAYEDALRAACAAYGWWLADQIHSGNAAAAFTIIRLQRRTLGAMLGHALDHQAWDDAGRILPALDKLWDVDGLSLEAAAWTDRILAAIGDPGHGLPEPTRSLWLYTTIAHANQQLSAGQPHQAAQSCLRALAYLQDQPATDLTRSRMAGWFSVLGTAQQMRGQLEEAENCCRKSLTLYKELGDRPRMAGICHQLGTTAQLRGRLQDAEDWYRKSLAIDKEFFNRRGMAVTYHQLGLIAQQRGQLEEAENWLLKSLSIEDEIGDRPRMAVTYHQLGMIAQQRGQLEEAENWLLKSLTAKDEFGNRPGMAATYHQLGMIAQQCGQLEEAENWLLKSLAIDEEFGNPRGMAIICAQLGLLAEGRGQALQALEWNIRCVILFSDFPSPLTGTGPSALARLTRRLGVPALEHAWQQATGQPVPEQVRDRITSQHNDESSLSVTDPVSQAARSAAIILSPDLDPSLPSRVEAVLAARSNQQRPDQYLDPVSLAGLIVSIATLVWTIYNDQRSRQNDHDPEPQPDVIARQARVTLRDADIQLPPDSDRITEIVVTEIIRHASSPHQPR